MLNKDQREILQDAINRARTFNLYAIWNTADDLHGAAMMIDLAAHVLWWDLSEDEKNDSSNSRPPTTNERTMYEDARHLWYSLIKASDARREKDIERARARAERAIPTTSIACMCKRKTSPGEPGRRKKVNVPLRDGL